MAGQTKRERFNKDYYAWPSPVTLIIYTLVHLFMIIVAYDATIVPPSLGFIRTFIVYVGENYRFIFVYWFWFAVILHVFVEAPMCFKMCRDAGMSSSATVKWVLATLIFGVYSFYHTLKPYLQRCKED